MLDLSLFDKINLADFNNLYVIAVGLSMAYIVVEANKKDKASFFSFLSSITNSVKRRVLAKPNRIKEEEESVITQIEYFFKSNLLKERTAGSLENINIRAKDELDKVKSFNEYVENKLWFHTKTDFLNVISCDCFLYGLFILFAGAFQKICGIYIGGLIVVLLIALVLLLIHCLWFEKLEPNSKIMYYYKPTIIKHVFFLIVALVIGINVNNCTLLSNISSGWLSVFSVLACFIGFIAYLFIVVLSNIVLSAITIKKARSLSPDTAQMHQNELNRHRDELDQIENDLRKMDLSSQNLHIQS